MTDQTTLLDDLIDRREAGRILGTPDGTLAAWVSRNQIPHYRISGRSVRFSRKELVSWLEERRVSAPKPTPPRRRRSRSQVQPAPVGFAEASLPPGDR